MTGSNRKTEIIKMKKNRKETNNIDTNDKLTELHGKWPGCGYAEKN